MKKIILILQTEIGGVANLNSYTVRVINFLLYYSILKMTH
jgi:hypothetical protein